MTDIWVLKLDTVIAPQVFKEFCDRVSARPEPAAENVGHVPYLLGTRFASPDGAMFLIMDGKDIVGCSGCYVSEFSKDIGLLGVRSWLEPAYRSQQIIRNVVLPAQRDWMRMKGVKQIALTFNEYNRNLVHLFERQIVKREPRTPRHMFYLGMHVLPYRAVIQHVPQWVIYETLEPGWKFDWFTLAYRDGPCLVTDGL